MMKYAYARYCIYTLQLIFDCRFTYDIIFALSLSSIRTHHFLYLQHQTAPQRFSSFSFSFFINLVLRFSLSTLYSTTQSFFHVIPIQKTVSIIKIHLSFNREQLTCHTERNLMRNKRTNPGDLLFTWHLIRLKMCVQVWVFTLCVWVVLYSENKILQYSDLESLNPQRWYVFHSVKCIRSKQFWRFLFLLLLFFIVWQVQTSYTNS